MPRTAVLGVALAWTCQYGALASLRRVRTNVGVSETEAELAREHVHGGRGGLLQQRRQLRAGSRQSLAEVMRSMTLQRAVEVVARRGDLPQGFRSFLQSLNEQARTGAGWRGSLRSGGYDTKTAKAALTRLVQQARQKLDMEQVQCSEYDLKHLVIMEEARREQDEYAAQAASAKAHILGAEADIDRASKGQGALSDTLERHKRKCELGSEVSRRQLGTAEDDVETMLKVVGRMRCSPGQAPATLVQCGEARRAASLLVYEQRFLRRALAGVRPSLKRALRQSLLQAAVRPVPALTPVLGAGGPVPPPGAAALANTSDSPTSRRKQRQKCTSRERPTCAVVTDKMLLILAALMDKVDELKSEMVTQQRECREAENNYDAQLSNLEFRVREAQTTLAESMTTQTQNDEQSRLKAMQVRDLVKDHAETMRQCKDNFMTFEHEMCGLRKIRSELSVMSGDRAYIQDCEVSEWTPEECPVSCGGGVQELKREVVTIPSKGGSVCPPLQMMRHCSEQACPVDCQLGAWSRWSSCTARCGGGVRQRAREVQREPKHGGASCGQTSEVEGCNLHACDKDCELEDWTDWSACSRMCGLGLRERTRGRSLAPVGEGHCPPTDGPDRLQHRPCNEGTCHLAPGHLTLRCNSTLDVIVLLQGSASLRAAGWKAMKRMGELLVRAFAGGDSRVGLVLWSGPRGVKAFLSCSRGAQPGEPLPDMAGDCSIRWVSHLSSDVEGVARKISGLSFPRGTTLTSAALTATLPELRMGRRDARSAVIVLTDGRPMSPRLTGQAAAMVREQARLLWVPVTRYAPLREIRQWSSKPVHENVIQVPGFKELAKPSTVSEIVSHVCPRVA